MRADCPRGGNRRRPALRYILAVMAVKPLPTPYPLFFQLTRTLGKKGLGYNSVHGFTAFSQAIDPVGVLGVFPRQ
jgi:hypothetical protein